MGTLKVHTNQELAPAHIDDGDDDAVLVEDRYLCFRWRESGSHEQQPSQRFIGRLGATVDQLQRLPKLCQAAHTRMHLGDCFDVGDLDVGGVHQRVDALNA